MSPQNGEEDGFELLIGRDGALVLTCLRERWLLSRRTRASAQDGLQEVVWATRSQDPHAGLTLQTLFLQALCMSLFPTCPPLFSPAWGSRGVTAASARQDFHCRVEGDEDPGGSTGPTAHPLPAAPPNSTAPPGLPLLPEAAFLEAQGTLQLPLIQGTHIRIIVYRWDQVLHQGLQGSRSEASILENEVPGAVAGPTSSFPHAGLYLSVTVGPKDAGEDHRCLGHSFLGKKNKGVSSVLDGLQPTHIYLVCVHGRMTRCPKERLLGSLVVPQALQI